MLGAPRKVLSPVRSGFLLAVALCAGVTAQAASLPVAELRREAPVDFETEVLPFLKNNCLACHNQTKAKANLNLEGPQTILQGGESGPAVVPGKGDESLIFKAAAHLDADLVMPPPDNKVNAASLTPEQLGLLKLWIEQGAKGEVRARAPVRWLDRPPQWNPIFAVALTRDGQFAACGRGQQLFVYHVPSGRLAARLTDPKLASAGLTNAAHRDLVNALAFNPDGTVLASAGYREVKLWRRLRAEPKAVATNLAPPVATGPDLKSLAAATNAVPDLQRDGPVTTLALSADGKRFATAGTNIGAKLWNAEDGKLIAELKGDRYADELVAETERALVIAKSDLDFQKKSLETAEADSKKQHERLTRATETNTVTTKAFAEREKSLREAQTAKAGADKALADLLAEIQKATESFEQADKHGKEAAAKAKAASEKAAQTQLAAERAAQAKVEAEKRAADAAAVAERSKAAAGADLPDEAKATAVKVAEDAEAVAQKTRSLAQALGAEAESKGRLASEAKAAAENAIEEVAALSFAAGELKPVYDKTLGEAPEKRKQATNAVESATKALASADREFNSAETRRAVTGHELELATKAAGAASNVVAEAKVALAAAETTLQATEAKLDRAKQRAAALRLPVRALAFSPDGLTLATLTDDGSVQTWSAETGAAFEVFGRDSSEARRARSDAPYLEAVHLPDVRTVIARLGSGRFVSWDLEPAWELERAIGSGDIDSPLADRVNAVCFSPDGQTLATGGGEPTRSGEIKLWGVADGELFREFANVHSDAVLALEFSPDGLHLASASADRFVRVTEMASGKVTRAFEGHTSYVLGVAWKRDSRTLASAGADNVIKVWDFVTGQRKKNIDGAGKEVSGIAYLGVTDQVVAASSDGQVRLLRDNGEKVRACEGATDFVNAVAATADGTILAAGGQDSVLRVWNGATGQLIAAFPPPNE
jgi:WD40 repeat protein